MLLAASCSKRFVTILCCTVNSLVQSIMVCHRHVSFIHLVPQAAYRLDESSSVYCTKSGLPFIICHISVVIHVLRLIVFLVGGRVRIASPCPLCLQQHEWLLIQHRTTSHTVNSMSDGILPVIASYVWHHTIIECRIWSDMSSRAERVCHRGSAANYRRPSVT